MSQVFGAPLFYIFFVYGLSFIVLSIVLFREISKASKIAMVSTFTVLAIFGLLHGLAEWTDWVRFIFNGGDVASFGAAAHEPGFLKYVSQILMVVSFVVLFQFAVNLLTYKSEGKAVRAIPVVLFVLYLIYIFASGTFASGVFNAGNIGRHIFGFIGATFAAIALLKLANEMVPLGNSRLVSGLAAAALGFAYYAVFGGLILHPVIGLPVQLFRMCCAVELAISSFYVLDVFRA